MKHFLQTLFIIHFLLLFTFCSNNELTKNEDSLKGQLSISGAFALYPMVVKWSEEFEKLHPDVVINVSAGGTGKGITDALTGSADFGMVSRDLNDVEITKGAFPIAVAKDAVVPIMNTENPLLSQIMKKGATPNELKDIWVTGKINSWEQLAESHNNYPMQVFTRSDASGAPETWAKFLGTNQEHLRGTGVFGDPGLAEAIKNDPHGIGYNNMVYAYDIKTRKPHESLTILPIDLNANNHIDADENFYYHYDTLIKAIQNQKYPEPPVRNLYLISKGKPTSPLAIEFLKFIFSKGQDYVIEAGYIPLSEETLKSQSEILY